MHFWAAIINSNCTYKNKNQKILIISKFPPQKLKSSFHMPKNYLRVYLSFSNSSSCLQKSSCAFNKKVPVHLPVRCLMGTWTQKVNSASLGTDSFYPPHLPPLNFNGNGINRSLDAKQLKKHVLIFLHRMCTWASLTNTRLIKLCTNTGCWL